MPFICRYRGGIYPTGKLPPCVCFVLFSYFAFPHDHQRPSQTTETVHNCFSGPSLDRRNVLCGERAVLHRFLRFSRALSLESSLSAHSCRLIKRKSTTSCHGRPFDHPFHSRWWRRSYRSSLHKNVTGGGATDSAQRFQAPYSPLAQRGERR